MSLNDRAPLWRIALSVVVALALVSLASCDTLFGSDDDDDEDDGRLTVWIRDAEDHNPCDPEGEKPAPLAIVWVYPDGFTDDDDYVAFGAWGFSPNEEGEIVSEVRIMERDPNDDPNENDRWKGKGGRTYVVYPTAYCAPLNDPGEPGSGPDGSKVDLEEDLALIYKGPGEPAGWGVPIIYTQDGDKTITTQAKDYVEPQP